MPQLPRGWDYLILTASNARQAAAYESQLGVRVRAGRLPRVRQTLVVTDLDDRRIGSGGSTLQCLFAVLQRECARLGLDPAAADPAALLAPLRVLIIHAGGDSRRLPAYGPCGKIFLPVPGPADAAFPHTLFDRLAPDFLALPPGAPGAGQIVVTAGDALLSLNSADLRLDRPGITMVGCHAAPEEAARHGVFAAAPDGSVRLYLQKPSLETQLASGAITPQGTTLLDAGVMSFDAPAAAALLNAFPRQGLAWTAETKALILAHGVDIYREIACALGSEATPAHFLASARAAGSPWPVAELAALFEPLHAIPLALEALPECSFLHFGSTRQLVESGLILATRDRSLEAGHSILALDNLGDAPLSGRQAWVEGCRLNAPLALAGANVVAGLDINTPLSLPLGATLDVLAGHDLEGRPVHFIRCYGAADDFKKPASQGGTFCGMALPEWLAAAQLDPSDLWDDSIPDDQRTLWNARVFPAEPEPNHDRWLWIFEPFKATVGHRQAFRLADRYSAADVALLADQDAFHQRRARLRADRLAANPAPLFQVQSRFSAADLTLSLASASDPETLKSSILDLAAAQPGLPAARLLHALGTATGNETLCAQAFTQLQSSIVSEDRGAVAPPRLALPPQAALWGRAPARIELGGGWTDTPPYTLEHGGDVANVAINLDGQPPIHAYLRLLDEPVLRLVSIDAGQRLDIHSVDELTDYRRPGDSFALSKAAISLAGFARGPLVETLKSFGGGFELTTLVGIPKGSGLGTSSILGSVLVAVLARLTGRTLSTRELFHEVLRLEQALTTGGGWQDQAGGANPGAKLTSTRPGPVPDPVVRYAPHTLLDPALNGGTTLLYYTGQTRIAKNILQQVVAGYLNRDGHILAALEEEHLVGRAVLDALSRLDAPALGAAVDAAWALQKRLCGDVTNPEIEALLRAVRPYVHGMRISGAGNGGFLFLLAKSPADAARVRETLNAAPPNSQARFFDFSVNTRGLEVSLC